MNAKSLLTLTAAAVLLSLNAFSQTTYHHLTFRSTCRVVSDSGQFVTRTLTEREIIRDCVQKAGLGTTNLMRFMLVYAVGADYNGDAIRVVWRQTGQTICEPYRVLFQESITDGQGRRDERIGIMFTQGDTDSKGSVILVRKPYVRSDGSLGPDIITGKFQVLDDLHFDRKAICTGNFIAGKQVAWD